MSDNLPSRSSVASNQRADQAKSLKSVGISDAASAHDQSYPDANIARWRDVFIWAVYILKIAPFWVAAEVSLSIAVNLMSIYSSIILGIVISGLQFGGRCVGEHCGSSQITLGILPLPHTARSSITVFTILTISLIVGGLVNRILGSYLSNKITGRLRQEVHDKILTLGPSLSEHFPSGLSVMVITSYVINAQMLLREIITAPIVRGVSLITAITMLSSMLLILKSQNSVLNFFLMSALVILPLIGWVLANRLRLPFGRAVDSQKRLVDEFLNSMSKPDEVQLMAAGPQRSKAFASRVATLTRDQFSAESEREIANAFQTAIPSFLQIILLLYGVFIALENGSPASAGAIVALYQLVPQAISPLQQLLQIYAAFTASWPQLKVVIELLKTGSEDRYDNDAELDPSDTAIAFNHVTFGYNSGQNKVIEDVTYRFDVGVVTAIVARFGVGKSTLLNLIARQHRPVSGKIFVGSKSLNEVGQKNLREKIVKVSQYPLFISDTVRENFKLSKADATESEIEEVCRRTGFWDVLVKETAPGESPLDYAVSRIDGVGLSGGQRRMLAVTRALLLKPAVLLLDEPTTGIDPIGRQELCETLIKSCVGLTVIVVDQDMNFISGFAQKICCLEAGKFSDVGTPSELKMRESLFAKLLNASSSSRN